MFARLQVQAFPDPADLRQRLNILETLPVRVDTQLTETGQLGFAFYL
jgi:hypothetical protein